MDDVEALLESVYTLYAKLAALKGIAGPELLLPGRTSTYKEVVADAYTAYRSVEVTVDALGQALEEERIRVVCRIKRVFRWFGESVRFSDSYILS